MKACELCESDGGEVVVRTAHWRVVRVLGAEGAAYPGFCRVIWNAHVKEMTDLSPAERDEFMAAVFAVEGALRSIFPMEKINLASLGNATPHLHWHVIPRRKDDPAFPQAIWAVTAPHVDKLATESVQPAWVTVLKHALIQN